jgi:nitrite reductase (NO-forming)
MVNKPVYIAASLIAVLSMISITASGHFSAFAQGSEEVKISMLPGGSTMGEKGYSPNPAHAKVGQKVEWINKDSVQHTITSGTPGSPDSGKEFDSGLTKLLNPGDKFEHTFTKAGDFSFYCQLHPTMLGHISVK